MLFDVFNFKGGKDVRFRRQQKEGQEAEPVLKTWRFWLAEKTTATMITRPAHVGGFFYSPPPSRRRKVTARLPLSTALASSLVERGDKKEEDEEIEGNGRTHRSAPTDTNETIRKEKQ
jgi:hypothetical protein